MRYLVGHLMKAAEMWDTIFVAAGIAIAFGFVFVGLFMRFARDWNGR